MFDSARMSPVLVGILVILFIIFLVYITCPAKENMDMQHAKKALEDLAKLKEHEIPEVSEQELSRLTDKIQMVRTKKDPNKEHMSFFDPINTRYWPYYYYTFPYRNLNSGTWPPNMFSRMYNWYPGFSTSGWSFWLRPGMYYGRWPRSRWVKNNGSYYLINNGMGSPSDYYPQL